MYRTILEVIKRKANTERLTPFLGRFILNTIGLTINNLNTIVVPPTTC
jgi:hypothetical protein